MNNLPMLFVTESACMTVISYNIKLWVPLVCHLRLDYNFLVNSEKVYNRVIGPVMCTIL